MTDNSYRFLGWSTILFAIGRNAVFVFYCLSFSLADFKSGSILFAQSIVGDNAEQAVETLSSNQPAQRNPSATLVSPCGFLAKSFIDEDKTEYSYMVYVPHGMKASDRLPLMVYLNGDGENGNDAIRPLRNGLALAIWEQQSRFPFVVVWPVCSSGDNWSNLGKSAARAIAIMQQVAEEYHTDADRVYLTGISSGGSGTWSIAAQHAELFAAMIPISGPGKGGDVDRVAGSNLPVWSYCVDIDPGMAESNKWIHQRLLESGMSPHLTELRAPPVPWVDRHDSWSFAYRDGGLFRWLAAQNRAERGKNQTRFELIKPTRFPAAIECVPTDGKSRSRDTKSTDRSVGLLKTRPLAFSQIAVRGLEELHLEFRPQAGVKRFGVGFFDSPKVDSSSTGAMIDLAVDDWNCGGIYSWPQRQCHRASFPVGELAVRVGAWNDLRVTLVDGRMTAKLNGWSLLENAQLPITGLDRIVGFVGFGDAGARVELQNVRIRQTENAAGNDELPASALIVENGQIASTRDLVSLNDSVAVLSVTPQTTQFRESVPPRMSPIPTLPRSNEGAISVDIAAIREAWTKREHAFSQLDIRWIEGPESRYVRPLFHSVNGNPSVEADVQPDRMVLSPDTVQYSTVWRHHLSEFWRDSTYQEYQREFHERFSLPPIHAVNSLRLGIRCENDRRIDTLFDATGQAFRRTISRTPDIWLRRAAELDELFWREPLVAFRPLSRHGLCCRWKDCHLLTETSIVDSVRCVMMEETRQGQFKRRFWMDPLRDFLILRVRGEFQEQLDIQYSQDSAGRWLPESWSAISKPMVTAVTRENQFPGMKWLFAVSSAKVVECVIRDSSVDAPLNDSFAPGAIVFDQISNEWSRRIAVDQEEKLASADVTQLLTGKRPPAEVSSVGNPRLPRRSWRFYVGSSAGLMLAVRLILIGLTFRTPR